MARKLIVIATEVPARDQPVSPRHGLEEYRQREHRADGDQVISAPSATMVHR